jgi:uncharacterized membrane protein SirB2
MSRPSWKSAWWGEKVLFIIVVLLVTGAIVQFVRGQSSQSGNLSLTALACTVLNFILKFWRGRHQATGLDQR